MSDIAGTLREYADAEDLSPQERTSLRTAADELERLRAELSDAAIKLDNAQQGAELIYQENERLRAELDAKHAAIENVRLLAARYRNEDWACHMLRFVEQAGITASPLRSTVPSVPDDTALLRQALEFCEFAWRDVNMNDYAFERLDDLINALRERLK